MKITIHGLDYTSALDAARPLTVERKINEPSICQLWLSLAANGSLASPSRFQTLAVTGDDGTPYFTGYIAVSPLPEYAGMGLEGPRYRTAIQAVSDELLLDQMLMPASVDAPGETAGALLAALVAHSGVDGALHTRAFTAGSSGRLRSRSGRELEQERGASRQHGAGRVSRAERRHHARLRIHHGASTERNRRQLESCQPGVYRQRKARTGQRCDGVRRERTGGLCDGVFSRRRRDHRI